MQTPLSPINLSLFGELSLSVDHRAVQLSSRDSRRLIAWLALSGPAAHSRHGIAHELFPDVEAKRALARISQALWRLRQDLPDGIPVVNATSSTLELERTVEVDIWIFDNAQHPAETIADVLAGASGPILVEWDEPFVRNRRDDWAEVVRTTCRQAVGNARAAGAATTALTISDAWHRLEPFEEEPVRARIEVLIDAGNHADAEFTYTELCSWMRDHLDTRPSFDIADLDGFVAPSSTLPLAPRIIPMVGRDQERATLLTLVDQVEAGEGATVFVEGDAGAGKSRLLAELSNDLDWRGVSTIVQRCGPADRPFAPLIGMLEFLTADRPDTVLSHAISPATQARLHRLEPRIVHAPPFAQHVADDPATARDLNVQAITDATLTLVGDRPMVIVIDDIHEATAETLRCLDALAAATQWSPLLLIMAFRGFEAREESAVWQALRDIDRITRPTRIQVNYLSLNSAIDLATAIDERVSIDLVRRVHAQTGGNPLLLLHIIDDLDQHSGQTLKLAADPFVDKIGRLGATDRHLIEALAVNDRPLGLVSLANACVLEIDEVRAATNRLAKQRLVDVHDGQIAVAHDRIADAVRAGMSDSNQSATAAGLATILPSDDSELGRRARLCELAGEWRAAADAYLQAAQVAQGLGAVELAAVYYEAALTPRETNIWSGAELLDIQLALIDVHEAAGETDAQATLLSKLEAGFDRDPPAEIAIRSGWFALTTGDLGRAAAIGRSLSSLEIRPVAPAGGPYRLWVEATIEIGAAIDDTAELQEAIGNVDDELERADALMAFSRLMLQTSSGDLGRAAVARAETIYRNRRHDAGRIDALHHLAMLEAHDGRADAGAALLETAATLAGKIGDARREVNAQIARANAYAVLGDQVGTAWPMYQEGTEGNTSTRRPSETRPPAQQRRPADWLVLRRLEGSRTLLLEAVETAEASNAKMVLAWVRSSLGEVAFACELHDEAIAQFSLAESIVDDTGSLIGAEGPAGFLAVLHAELGDRHATDRYLAIASETAASSAHRGSRPAALGQPVAISPRTRRFRPCSGRCTRSGCSVVPGRVRLPQLLLAPRQMLACERKRARGK